MLRNKSITNDISPGISRDQLATIGDLENLKASLVEEIRQLLQGSSSHHTKPWLRSSEVRKMLGISHGTLQNLRINGTLSYTKLGGVILYRYEDIVRRLNQNANSNRNGQV